MTQDNKKNEEQSKRENFSTIKNIARHKGHVPFRLNFLFFIIFMLFIALIIRLADLQIVNGANWDKQIKSATVTEVKQSTPRGSIYDSKGNLLAGNSSNAAITFTRTTAMRASDMLETSTKLAKLIEFPLNENLTKRDLSDYYLADANNLKKAEEKLTGKQKLFSPGEQYQAMVDGIPEESLHFSDEQLKIASIYAKLNAGQNLVPAYVKSNDVTQEELAVVAENSSELPGISTGTDWQRQVTTNDEMLKQIIGRVSTEKQGLPAEEAGEYLKKGYFSNDRVGTSYLEKQYEADLQGKKTQSEIVINHKGAIESTKTLQPGAKGDNLKLTIDSDFQNKVDNIVKTSYQSMVNSGEAQYSNGIYAVAMNPKTGAILALSSYNHQVNSREIDPNAIGVFQNGVVPGSTIKAATINTGWNNKVISGNATIYDQPIYLAGGSKKASIFNPDGRGNRVLTATKALELSSNSYMIQIGLKLLGINYAGGTISIPSIDSQKDAYEKLRAGFAQYGLGVKTGIDIPNEEIGSSPKFEDLSLTDDGAKILDLTFGQFDTYTPIQLLQYAAAIANGGQRVQPHLVEGIYGNDPNGNLGDAKKVIETKILNHITITPEEMGILRQGFYDVVHGHDPNTTAASMATTKMSVAGKTGTAETSVTVNGRLIPLINTNAVFYGPSDDAQIAVAVLIPKVSIHDVSHSNLVISKEILNAYYDMYLSK